MHDEAIVYAAPYIKLYPNPTTNTCNISSTVVGSIEVLDLLGRSMLQQPITIGVQAFNTTSWSSGTYIYRIITNNEPVYYGKLLKE